MTLTIYQLWNDKPKTPPNAQNDQKQYSACSYQKYTTDQQTKGWKVLGELLDKEEMEVELP